ncbi:hypothetical protein BS78_10G167700 [Paspalum vaginatum]|nr:hypothetical protein BS78_10G167700 [Paspalum vaginatum]
MNYLCWPVHLKMKKGITVFSISLLFLLSLAFQGSWCAAEGSAGVSAERHRLRPHLQSPSRKLGLGHDFEASPVEMKHNRRMATGHKGGTMGGAAGGGSGGAVTRPHSSKNGAAALPVPVAHVLALAFGCGVALSALGF